MLKVLTNKLPCRVGPWNISNLKYGIPRLTDLLTELPNDVDFVESYTFDFNRFIQPGKNGYVRLHLYYTSTTSTSEIQSVCSQFRATRIRWLELSHSNAVKPVHIGCLTGSVRAMATSTDFYDVFKTKFGLTELGLWFTQPRSAKSGEYNKAKHTLHIEIDRDDLPKRVYIENFFNTSKSNSSAFFGVPMILTPAFDYFAEDDVKASLENHSRK